MGMNVEATTVPQSVTIQSGQAESGVIDYRGYSKGGFTTPATLDATTVIAFKVCDTPGGTFLDLRDGANALKTVTVDLAASHAYPLPAELAGFAYFKIWTQASGANVNQTGAKVFVVHCKGA